MVNCVRLSLFYQGETISYMRNTCTDPIAYHTLRLIEKLSSVIKYNILREIIINFAVCKKLSSECCKLSLLNVYNIKMVLLSYKQQAYII